jgi:hypothetical protein
VPHCTEAGSEPGKSPRAGGLGREVTEATGAQRRAPPYEKSTSRKRRRTAANRLANRQRVRYATKCRPRQRA